MDVKLDVAQFSKQVNSGQDQCFPLYPPSSMKHKLSKQEKFYQKWGLYLYKMPDGWTANISGIDANLRKEEKPVIYCPFYFYSNKIIVQ